MQEQAVANPIAPGPLSTEQRRAPAQSGAESGPASQASRSTLKKPERYPWLDVLRALAIGDIVGIHVAGFHPMLGMGLPVFLLCTFALGAKRTPPHPWKQNAIRRASRLLIPWLVWSAFYGVVNTVRAARSGNERFGDLTNPELAWLWTGTEVLLWYLPFAFLAEVLINTILQGTDRWHNRRPTLATFAWVGGGIAGPIGLAVAFGDRTLLPFMSNYAQGALLIPMGIGLGLLLRYYRQSISTVATLIVAGGVTMAVMTLAPQFGLVDPDDRITDWLWRLGLGLALIGGTLAIPGRVPALLGWLAMFTFPIYLLHIFVEWPVGRVLHYAVGDVPGWAYWLIIWAASLGAAVVVKRLPLVKNVC
ncbi:MAG: acyltransferase family protein [Phycisphaeraceae bacterium]